jgi:uncharacterized protein YbjT (DUF2867 family)
MANLIVVLGATGQQGGGVIDALAQYPSKYKIRGLTRKAAGDKAKLLEAKGVEVVAADLNSEESLAKAFDGAWAIFAVTPYWESIWTLGRHGAGEEEVDQQKAIARAASQTPTLQHFVLSCLPAASKISAAKHAVPHFDYKEKALDWMKTNTPDVVGKMTRVWPGWYGNNMLALPIFRFLKYPDPIPGYLIAQPARRDSILPVVGEISATTGAVVRAVLERGDAMHGKVVPMITEYIEIQELAKYFTRATGKPCGYGELTDADAEAMWGELLGAEMACQLRWSEDHPDWHAFEPENTVSLRELGIVTECPKLEDYMKSIADKLV